MDVRRRNIGGSIKVTTGGGSSTSGTYTINLNGQWEKTTAVSNPDSSLYDGVYRSSSNYNVSNGVSIMYITIRDCSTFKMYIRSYAESTCDYVMVSQIDVSINGSTSYSNTTLVKAHTCGNQQSGTALTSYTLVEYTGISSGEHTITVVYRKDGSVNSGDDRGYVLIPYIGEGNNSGSGDGDIDIDMSNAILYTSTDGKIVTPYSTSGIGVNVLNNIYQNGQGAIIFDAPLPLVDNNMFSSKRTLDTAILPDTITSIGNSAFYNCSGLKNVNIPEGTISIGNSAFYSCSGLTEIAVPDSVQTLGTYVFYNCDSLTEITIPDSVKSVGSYSFGGCEKLKTITIGNGLSTLEDSLFSYCRTLKEVKLGSGLTSFGSSLFSNSPMVKDIYCKATTPPLLDFITFYDGISGPCNIHVPYNSFYAYKHGKWRKIYKDIFFLDPYDFTNDTQVDEPILNNDEIWYISNTDSVITPYNTSGFSPSIKTHIFDYGKGIIKFNGNVTQVGSSAFYNIDDLTHILLPETITSIGSSAFTSTSLYDITIPKNVKTIGSGAFMNCTSLGTVTLPEGLETIGAEAFDRCTAITYIRIPDSVKYINEDAFRQVKCEIDFGNGDPNFKLSDWGLNFKKISGKYASSDNMCYVKNNKILFAGACPSDYTIPNGITEIGESAFYWQRKLTSLTIPDSVIKLDNKCFRRCEILETVKMGNSVQSIGDYAFSNCKINDIIFSENLKTIGKYSLGGGATYTNLVLPNSVQSIGEYAFDSSNNLVSCTIGENVTTIGDHLFSYCKKLETLYIKAVTPPTGSAYSLFINGTVPTIYVPTASVEAYKTASGWSRYKDNIVGYDF